MATAEAPAVTVSPARIASPTNLELFAFFDSTERLGYSFVDLFEHSTPGATEALVAWAHARGLVACERKVPAGNATSIATTVQLRADDMTGPRINVFRAMESL